MNTREKFLVTRNLIYLLRESLPRVQTAPTNDYCDEIGNSVKCLPALFDTCSSLMWEYLLE